MGVSKRVFNRRLGGAVLGLACLGFLSPADAWAGQSISINGVTGPYTIIGNGEADGTVPSLDKLRDPNGNILNISNSTVLSAIGGYSLDGKANNNRLTVTNSQATEAFLGGLTIQGTKLEASGNNLVLINSSSMGSGFLNLIAGGAAYDSSGTAISAIANSNSVSISGGEFDKGVSGGAAIAAASNGSATANNNSASISGGIFHKDVYGGGAMVLASNGSATANNNSASISNAEIFGVVSGAMAEADGNATANSNNVVLNNAILHQSVYGGRSESNSGSATADSNNVVINGGRIIDSVVGGYAESSSGNVTANNNSVVINGGRIDKEVSGGVARSNVGNATANNNRVVINGGHVGAGVCGGTVKSSSGSLTAIGNTVTLSGAIQFASNSVIVGGNPLSGISIGDFFSRNTLNLWNYQGSEVKGVGHFEFFNFTLPAHVANGDSVLEITSGLYLEDPSISGRFSTITGVNIMGGGAVLPVGTTVTLLDVVSGGSTTGTFSNLGIVQGSKGVSLLYDWTVARVGDSFTATVSGVRGHPRAKALSEGRAANIAFTNQGADLISDKGSIAAMNAGLGLGAFMVGEAGSSRYESGSHVNVDGFSLMGGLAWNFRTDYNKLMLGLFAEMGWGEYDSHNSFAGFASVKGEGDSKYYGGGILGRLDVNAGSGVLYTEASLRAGVMKNDFNSNDLRDGIDRAASYNSSSSYVGAHLGLGYVWNISSNSSLDVYAKYFWTRQGSDSVNVLGDPIRFDAANSHRARIGARYAYSLNTASGMTLAPYVGAAYEHEFDGRAKASAYGHKLDAPELKGGTGIGELGLSFKPSANGGLSLDLGVRGYVGQRRGVTGGLQVKFEF